MSSQGGARGGVWGWREVAVFKQASIVVLRAERVTLENLDTSLYLIGYYYYWSPGAWMTSR